MSITASSITLNLPNGLANGLTQEIVKLARRRRLFGCWDVHRCVDSLGQLSKAWQRGLRVGADACEHVDDLKRHEVQKRRQNASNRDQDDLAARAQGAAGI